MDTSYFVYCRKCEYRQYYHPGISRSSRVKWVYSDGVGQVFPLIKRKGWCPDCNRIEAQEHIPDETEINLFLAETERKLEKYLSGDMDHWEEVDASHAHLVIKGGNAWHAWRRTRNFGRCLVCGNSYRSQIDQLALDNCSGRLPLLHHGCGGDLFFGKEEAEFLSINRKLPELGDPIFFETYSFAGLPNGENLSLYKRGLERKHPGSIVELESSVKLVIAGLAKNGNDLKFQSFPASCSGAKLSDSIFKFIAQELSGNSWSKGLPSDFSIEFPDIHRLAAMIIREILNGTQVREGFLQADPLPPKTTSPRFFMQFHRNPFYVLSVNVRDNRRRIVELAEEKSLEVDHEVCQKARSDLTNPRSRLNVEMAWLPGVSPRKASQLIESLLQDPMAIREESGLPTLAHLNLLAAAFEAVDGKHDADDLACFIVEIAYLSEELTPEEVLRDINEDRAVSGFPELRALDQIEAELTERKRYYRGAIKDALNRLPPLTLIQVMTEAVDGATSGGHDHAPGLIDDLVDSYEVETQDILQKEAENVQKLIKAARDNVGAGESALTPYVDKLDAVARNWDKIAQPIQLSSKARGIEHAASRSLAYEIRGLAIELFNKHGLLVHSQRLTGLIQEIFSEVPEIADRVEEDANALADIFQQRKQSASRRDELAREITYSAEVGVMFKETLSISPDGVSWKGKNFPLDSITRVRWGGVSHSVNGIRTGTSYTIAFGNRSSESVVDLKKKDIYNTFIDKLWRAICVRLMTEMLEALKSGRDLHFGDAVLHDDGVTLVKRKLLGSNEKVRYTWDQIHVWSADGAFCIGSKDDKKANANISYINVANTHIMEQAIRMGFKKPEMDRLSELIQ